MRRPGRTCVENIYIVLLIGLLLTWNHFLDNGQNHRFTVNVHYVIDPRTPNGGGVLIYKWNSIPNVRQVSINKSQGIGLCVSVQREDGTLFGSTALAENSFF